MKIQLKTAVLSFCLVFGLASEAGPALKTPTVSPKTVYRVNVKASAGENMLPDDGYFSPDRPMHLNFSGSLSPGNSVRLEKCRYEKSEFVLEIDTSENKKSGYLQFSTVKMPVTNNLMVMEVMARTAGKGINPHFAVIAIASKYKYISHKRYNLTGNWRKYVAIVEIPKDPKNQNIFWGRVDIPAGCKVQIGRIAVYSMVNNTKVAGWADDAMTEAKKRSAEPNLQDSRTPVPTATKLISSQIGNCNPIRKIKTRLSSEISEGNIAGAALCDYPAFECPVKGEAYGYWSPWWVIADPSVKSAVVDTCFSSAMRFPYSGGETLTVRWKKPVKINRIRLTPRHKKLSGFPIDWHFEISRDGKAFREVFRAKNYNQEGEKVLIEFPEQVVAAVRMTADKIRPETKRHGYFQLRRLEALTSAGKNLALPQFGASAESNNPLSMPLLSHRRFYDHIVRCGIKTVLITINAYPKGYNSINDGIALGSRGYENLTALMQFLKRHGVNTIIRLTLGLQTRRVPPGQLKDLPRKFATQYLPHIRSWKGLVKSYALAGEENQYRMGRPLIYPIKDYIRYFNDSCIACAKEIRKIEPDAEIAVATALFDFGWTEGQLKYGLGKPGLVDTFSVHIYRESDPYGSYPEKCYSFFVDGRRGLETERMFIRAEDEIKAYRKLLDKYNPKLKMSSNETSMRTGTYCWGMATTEAGQAKYVGRQFVMHQFYKIGPNLWWAFIGTRRKDHDGLLWGMVDISDKERKVQAWHSYSYFNAVFDNSWQPDKEFGLIFKPTDKRFYSYTFKRGKEWMAAAWVAVSMRDGNTGKETDILIPGRFLPDVEVECIDLLNGGIQKMNVVHTEKGLLLKGIILRDYVLVFRPVKK